jgi:hypothetical protein
MKTIRTIHYDDEIVTLRSRPYSPKDQRSPRQYWFQIHYKDDRIENRQKMLTWHGAIGYGDSIMSALGGTIEVMFLVDGNIPRSLLDFVPQEAIWNRWELNYFEECGKPCVQFDPAKEILFNAIESAAKLR